MGRFLGRLAPRVRSHFPRSAHYTVVVVALIATAFAFEPAAAVPSTDAAAAMEKFLARPANAHQYRASRRLEASGSGQRGWLVVQTAFTPASGLRYDVTAEGGSRYIRSRVLRSLLDEEQRLIARGASADVALSMDNYQFTSEGVNEEGLVLVAMKPLRKEPALIVGRLFLTASGDPVRVEGRLVKTPSFWLKRIAVVRAYRRLNGVLVPVSLHSTGQLRLLGRSTLHMSYDYSEIDDRPVREELPD
jgi:hypothetical protein